jgi:vacuolar-type H+-ATPase subunit E/Vma4
MSKYDKSLVEVWEWRQKVHDELKGLTNEEYVKRVREQADTILAKYNIKLKRVETNKDHQKIA